jgi:hypothetical protein
LNPPAAVSALKAIDFRLRQYSALLGMAIQPHQAMMAAHSPLSTLSRANRNCAHRCGSR